MGKHKTIILGVTASIAIYKACDIVRRLREKGFGVTVVMTQEATQLMSPVVFQSLSNNKVYKGLFEETAAWDVEHVSLAQQADLILIAPATANIIAKIACGICDDMLTCVVSATKAPVVVCPAMNEHMFRNKITQQNVEKLKKLGYSFIGPRKGKLACGTEGVGCLAEISEIVSGAQRSIR